MAKPNQHQLQLATLLGIDITSNTEQVAAARLEDHVALAIHPGQEPRFATDRQIAFGQSLGLDLRNDSLRVASAKIEEELYAMNQAAVIDLDLRPGDRVIKRQRVEIDGRIHNLDREYVVSSVDDNFRVWFKGGNGQGAWPTELDKAREEAC